MQGIDMHLYVYMCGPRYMYVATCVCVYMNAKFSICIWLLVYLLSYIVLLDVTKIFFLSVNVLFCIVILLLYVYVYVPIWPTKLVFCVLYVKNLRW